MCRSEILDAEKKTYEEKEREKSAPKRARCKTA
jgi:hypothetical protein